MNTAPLAIYIHYPFCAKKCPYCDFNSYVKREVDHDAWCNAYVHTIKHYASLLPDRHITSVFFGGGTPSLMAAETCTSILETIRTSWPASNDIEITLEANPTSAEADKFRAFKAAGVNRVSLGVQSIKDEDLKFLGREHTAKEALDAVDMAAGIFDRYSFDLIYARPQQTLKEWEAELTSALKHVDKHMSLYQLTIEESTPFYMDEARGKFKMPDDTLSADFYLLTQEIMSAHGLPAYEVSNHAPAGEESRHNMTYWQYGDYIGIGPGAHGRVTFNGQKHATYEYKTPVKWLKKSNNTDINLKNDTDRNENKIYIPSAQKIDPLSPEDRFTEALLTGLRLYKGLNLKTLSEKSGYDWQNVLDLQKLRQMEEDQYLTLEGSHLTLSTEGMLRLNALLSYIIKG